VITGKLPDLIGISRMKFAFLPVPLFQPEDIRVSNNFTIFSGSRMAYSTWHTQHSDSPDASARQSLVHIRYRHGEPRTSVVSARSL
jgi:hypothetical protein